MVPSYLTRLPLCNAQLLSFLIGCWAPAVGQKSLPNFLVIIIKMIITIIITMIITTKAIIIIIVIIIVVIIIIIKN